MGLRVRQRPSGLGSQQLHALHGVAPQRHGLERGGDEHRGDRVVHAHGREHGSAYTGLDDGGDGERVGGIVLDDDRAPVGATARGEALGGGQGAERERVGQAAQVPDAIGGRLVVEEAERGGVEAQVEHRVHHRPQHLLALEAGYCATGAGHRGQQVGPVLRLGLGELEGPVGEVQRGQRLAQAPGHPRHRLTDEDAHRQGEDRGAERLCAGIGDDKRHQIGGAGQRQELQRRARRMGRTQPGEGDEEEHRVAVALVSRAEVVQGDEAERDGHEPQGGGLRPTVPGHLPDEGSRRHRDQGQCDQRGAVRRRWRRHDGRGHPHQRAARDEERSRQASRDPRADRSVHQRCCRLDRR